MDAVTFVSTTKVSRFGSGLAFELPPELREILSDGQAVQLRWDENGNLIITPLDDDDLAELPGLQRMAEEVLAEEDEVLPYREAMEEIDRKRGRTAA